MIDNVTNKQIAAYLEDRPLKQHEDEMLARLCRDLPRFSGRLLDIGCADGNFLQALTNQFPDADLAGLDANSQLLSVATMRFSEKRVELIEANAATFQPSEPFDALVASGILSVFEDFSAVLKRWISWLRPGGRLYVFGRFNTCNIDTIVRIRNNYRGGEWESGLTAFSIQTVSQFLDKQGLAHEFQRFQLQVSLLQQEDPVRTYTVDTVDGRRLVVNGANLIAEHHFLIVTKPVAADALEHPIHISQERTAT